LPLRTPCRLQPVPFSVPNPLSPRVLSARAMSLNRPRAVFCRSADSATWCLWVHARQGTVGEGGHSPPPKTSAPGPAARPAPVPAAAWTLPRVPPATAIEQSAYLEVRLPLIRHLAPPLAPPLAQAAIPCDARSQHAQSAALTLSRISTARGASAFTGAVNGSRAHTRHTIQRVAR